MSAALVAFNRCISLGENSSATPSLTPKYRRRRCLIGFFFSPARAARPRAGLIGSMRFFPARKYCFTTCIPRPRSLRASCSVGSSPSSCSSSSAAAVGIVSPLAAFMPFFRFA